MRTRTNRFHARAWRRVVSFAIEVRYDASPVMTLLFDAARADMSSPFSPISAKGSPISFAGVALGVWALEEALLDAALLERLLEGCWRPDACLVPLLLLPEGDASRESVLRKADLRFGGTGSDATSIGGDGILSPGKLSRSLAWSSTTS